MKKKPHKLSLSLLILFIVSNSVQILFPYTNSFSLSKDIENSNSCFLQQSATTLLWNYSTGDKINSISMSSDELT